MREDLRRRSGYRPDDTEKEFEMRSNNNKDEEEQALISGNKKHKMFTYRKHVHTRGSFSDDELPYNKRRRNPNYLFTSDSSAFILSLLVRTALVALPCVLGFGLSFEADAMKRSLTKVHWSSGLIFSFIFLLILGPIHEAAVCACILYNSALTTLIAGGFKSTALSTYRAAIHQTSASDPAALIGMIISSFASLLYTHEWWLEQTRREQIRRELREADLATADLIAEDSDDDDEHASLLPRHGNDLQRRDQHYDHIPILYRSNSAVQSSSSVRRGSSFSRGRTASTGLERPQSAGRKKNNSSSSAKKQNRALSNPLNVAVVSTKSSTAHHPPVPPGNSSPTPSSSLPRSLARRPPP